MDFEKDVRPYIDKNGLIAPEKGGSSLNGVMYTAELLIVAWERLTEEQRWGLRHAIASCEIEYGLMGRVPYPHEQQQQVDDMYAYAALCMTTRLKYGRDRLLRAHDVLQYGYKHFGSFNTVNPGVWTWNSFLWRQPQLLGAFLAARGNVKPWERPFLWYAALAIFVSCRNTPKSDADARRLAWHLIKAVSPESWLMRQAAKGWYKRLLRDYGPEGMREVGRHYYTDHENPLIKFHEGAEK
jgi:hypothetical protein